MNVSTGCIALVLCNNIIVVWCLMALTNLADANFNVFHGVQFKIDRLSSLCCMVVEAVLGQGIQ